MNRMRDLKVEIEGAYKEEETYWKEICKNTWLKEGDRNTKVFHGWAQTRKMKNRISSLMDHNGVEHFPEDEKGEIAVKYFEDLFHSASPADASELLEDFVPIVTERMNQLLTAPVSDNEIKKAVKAVKSDSAPGADGMTGKFFQSYWNITGAQITKEVKDFFAGGELPQDWNFTQLCLLPKKPNPTLITDLRPISLCSVVYKIISNVLCARLKRILPQIVSPTQGAFVSGRLISDNLLIAHEMIHGLKTNPNCKEEYIAIKIDMSKAYDRVEWDFLKLLFEKMGFTRTWIDWVMKCVRSVSYTVLLNGQTHGHIQPQRGIRQGDPLSPFIFILCAEALVHVMNRAEQRGAIHGMKLTRKCPSVQHLLFADDSFFLCKANLPEVQEFLRCLKLYGDSSGQFINFQKSAIMFGANVDPIMKRLIAEISGIDKEGGDGKYLGLPECFSGSKQQLLAFIGEKPSKRLKGWFAKKVSMSGKEVLLKSIAMALPVYAMSCFRLTKHHCQKIMSAMASFWWNACEDKNKIHWLSWDKLCMSKDNGGLGFRDIEDFNQALLAKQAWRLMNEPNSLLAQIYKGRYYASKDFLDCSKGFRPSYAWRSITFGKELLKKGLYRSVGTGENTFIWTDNWIMDSTPRLPVNKERDIEVNRKVSSLLNVNGQWDQEILQRLFPPNEVSRILKISPGNVEDRDIWAFTDQGAYTVKSGYWFAANVVKNPTMQRSQQAQEVIDLKKKIWKVKTLPKIRMFLWRAVSGALAVAERLNTRGMQVNETCKLCNADTESINHVLFQCQPAKDLLQVTNFPADTQPPRSLLENVKIAIKLTAEANIGTEKNRAIPWLLWSIWKNRNAILYAGVQESITVIINQALTEEAAWTAINFPTPPIIVVPDRLVITDSWQRPQQGVIKCNIHANWRSAAFLIGVSWISRDHQGNVLHHARDALTSSPNRIEAELRCTIWAMQSLKDLGFPHIIIGLDLLSAFQAIVNVVNWPRFRHLLRSIDKLRESFQSVEFEHESQSTNIIARDIARSVLRDGRFRSYMALGGPAWLHDRIQREAANVNL
ncbi:uncharacterized protein LOC108844873 [Raphanus sativus]|uniref:Uncharacterized protein LOC108844873 n=1 Tax=Raphanus sativus TaxID=3726 RepID=A0A6J0MMD9_RAPSA|nr:uncharacterized protein LOC108844873 [Raphanus sativus]